MTGRRGSTRLSARFGTDGPDTLIGGPGRDLLYGLGGDDTLLGLDGDDLLVGGRGNDRLEGGDGDDLIRGDGGDNRIDAGEGDNRIHVDDGDNLIVAGSGDDRIRADDGDNVIDAGDGDNRVHVDDGDNVITTGSGDDRIRADDGDNVIDAGEGDNVIHVDDGDNRITAGDGDDRVRADDGNNVIDVGDGDNDIRVDDGDNAIVAGSGDDRIRADDGDNTIDAGDGDNVIHVDDGDNRITAGAGDDRIRTDDGDNVIDAGDGRNRIRTGRGDDSVLTGAGDDRIRTDGGDDTVQAGAGDDTVRAGTGDDLVVHSVAANADATDYYDGGKGADTLLLELTRSEWLQPAVQADIARFLDWADGGGHPRNAAFQFSAFDLKVRRFENLRVSIDGVETDPRDETVTARDDAAKTDENTAVSGNVLDNDDVPDLVRTVRLVSDVSRGVLTLASDGSFTFDPGSDFDALAVGTSATEQFIYELEDADGDIGQATVTITVEGANDAPVVADVFIGAIEDGPAVDGAFLGNDVDVDDDGASLTYAITTGPVEGSVVANGDGTFRFDPGADFQDLAEGATRQVSFTYEATDRHGSVSDAGTVTVTVTGTNDAPVIAFEAGNDGGAVQEDGTIVATGQLTASDADSGATATWSIADGAGVYGTLSVDQTGRWTYVLDNDAANVQGLGAGDIVTETFSVRVDDGQGGADARDVVITITGSDDAPKITFPDTDADGNGVADAIEGTVVEDDPVNTVSGQLSAADADGGALPVWSVDGGGAGTYGALTVDQTGLWTYTLDNALPQVQGLSAGEAVAETFTIAVADGGATDSQDVTITVVGTNDAPVIAGDGSGGTGRLQRISTDANGVQGNGDSALPRFIGDGTRIAFDSRASNLVPGDTNGVTDSFVKDLVTGAITRVNTAPDGSEANGGTTITSFSADGTRIAFHSSATNLVPGATTALINAYVKDLTTGEVTLIGADSNGIPADENTFDAVLTPDGTKAVFVGVADNLVPGDTNGSTDIFLKDLSTGAVSRVSTPLSGGQANFGGSSEPALSADGTKMVFVSGADNLVPGDTNGARDIFVKNLVTGAVTRASTDASGNEGNATSGNSSAPAISADGTKVVFTSLANNLVPGDTNGQSDIFVKDLITGEITRVSTDSAGNQANGSSFSFDQSISADGTKVSFWSNASNLVPGDTNNELDVFVKDLTTGETIRVSVGDDGSQGNGRSRFSAFSPDGSMLAFYSSADNLVPGDTNGEDDVFLVDLTATPVDLTLNELPGTTGSSVLLSGSGVLDFTDVDLNDVGHTARVIDVAVSGATVGLPDLTFVQDYLDVTGVTKVAGSADGTIDWTFAAEDQNFDYLALGEQVTLAYTVELDDGDGGIDTGSVTVTVNGENDAPVLTLPSNIAIPENTTSVLALSATDVDTDAGLLSYGIVGGADASLFSVDATGNLTFLEAPDFENPQDADGDNIYLVEVSASDGLDVTSETISVVVTDADDGSVPSGSLANVNGINGFKIIGEMDDDEAGGEVSFAGDVNGDGYDDVILGATKNDAAGDNAGAAYVVYGGPDIPSPVQLSAIAQGQGGFKILGENPGDRAANSVSDAGDVNGDGIDDVIIGATFESSAGEKAGAAYVVYGAEGGLAGVDLADIASNIGGFKLTGENAQDLAGTSVSSAGDVNGDGIDDLVVGAFFNGPPLNNPGAAYVVYGAADGLQSLSLSAIAQGIGGFKITGEIRGDNAGRPVSAAGDVNGDGIDDIIVGANSNREGGSLAGAAYVVYGAEGGFPAVDLADVANGIGGFKMIGEAEFDFAGGSVSGAGDINGDGIDDVVVGAIFNDANGNLSGASYVVYGTPGGRSSVSLTDIAQGNGGFRIVGESELDKSGVSVSGAGDLNGDGIDDLVVGAIDQETGGPEAGAAYVVYGVEGGLSEVNLADVAKGIGGFRLVGEEADGKTGDSVSPAGDVNADGFDDILIGSYLNDSGGSRIGAAYVFYGGNFTGAVSHLGTEDEDTLNGTGNADVMIGGRGDDTIMGFGGDDRIKGAGGNDAISGGTGADLLSGGTDADLYLFARGDGEDTIENMGRAADGDTLRFAAGIDTDDLLLQANGNDLLITVLGNGGSVTVTDWFVGTDNTISAIEAGDGSTLGVGGVTALVTAMAGFDVTPGPGEAPPTSLQEDADIVAALAANWQTA